MQRYCQNESKFNGAYSKNLRKVNVVECVTNLDGYKSIETN